MKYRPMSQIKPGERCGRVDIMYRKGFAIERNMSIWHCRCELCRTEGDYTTESLRKSKTVCRACRHVKDHRGEVFTRLTIKEFGNFTKNGCTWICECSCTEGVIVETTYEQLKRGDKKSCGCLYKETRGIYFYKHGDSGTRFYAEWKGMKGRCDIPTHTGYKYYGGRNIGYQKDWVNYETFKRDMYDSYLEFVKIYGEKNATLGRIDVNKDYTKENCRWVTNKMQQQNKRDNYSVYWQGIYYNSIQRLLDEYNFSENDNRRLSNVVLNRIRNGWTEKEAIIIPPLDPGTTKEMWYRDHNLTSSSDLPDTPIRKVVSFDPSLIKNNRK